MAEQLDGADHARYSARTAIGGAVDGDHRAGGCPAELAALQGILHDRPDDRPQEALPLEPQAITVLLAEAGYTRG